MKIYIRKFGAILTSRQFGGESWMALNLLLVGLRANESIEVDFDGVSVFTPAWGDEFITPLNNGYSGRITLINTENPSVQMGLDMLRKIRKYDF